MDMMEKKRTFLMWRRAAFVAVAAVMSVGLIACGKPAAETADPQEISQQASAGAVPSVPRVPEKTEDEPSEQIQEASSTEAAEQELSEEQTESPQLASDDMGLQHNGRIGDGSEDTEQELSSIAYDEKDPKGLSSLVVPDSFPSELSGADVKTALEAYMQNHGIAAIKESRAYSPVVTIEDVEGMDSEVVRWPYEIRGQDDVWYRLALVYYKGLWGLVAEDASVIPANIAQENNVQESSTETTVETAVAG